MKILVSAYACHPQATEDSYPGEAILGWNLVRQLSRKHKLWVITRAYNREGIAHAQRAGEASGVEFVYLALPKVFAGLLRNFFGFRVYYLFWQIQAYRIARKLHRHLRFEACHQITFNNDWMPSFIGALLPVPFFWGPIGGGQRVPPNLMRELDFKNRATERARIVGQWFWRANYFRRRAARRARAILVCNQETEDKILPLNPKIHFFPVNGIAPEDCAYVPRPSRPSRSAFHVLFAGRLDPIKGLGLGLEAFDRFSRGYPAAVLEIIGSGPEEHRLKKIAADLKLQPRILWTPWLPRPDLLARMAGCDVFLFPSFRDGGGAVVVEAMAAGKPVIALDVGGPGFHLQPEWGIKIAPGNPRQVVADIAAALENLFLEEDLRRRLGIAARQRACEFYTWGHLGDTLLDIYEAVFQPGARQASQ